MMALTESPRFNTPSLSSLTTYFLYFRMLMTCQDEENGIMYTKNGFIVLPNKPPYLLPIPVQIRDYPRIPDS